MMMAALLDLFLTVLYARAGAGFISDRVARSTWAVFHWSSRTFGRFREVVLSLSGSAIVVALVATWASTDFLSALYAGGSSMSLVSSSDYSAKTTVFRMVYLFNSLVGMSVMSLALTYVMQVYDALQQQNTFGLSLEQMSRGTGDAAVLIQGLAPNNEFSPDTAI